MSDTGKGDVLTIDILRKALSYSPGIPQRRYYTLHPGMWDSFIEMGWTDEQLETYGFIKPTYIPIEKVRR